MPIPDEKARAWTRPEDYWPPRRPARSGRKAATHRRVHSGDDRGDPIDSPRALLGVVPYALLMLGLGVLAIAIIVVAWPGNRTPVQKPAATEITTTVEIGTAPKGWLQQK